MRYNVGDRKIFQPVEGKAMKGNEWKLALAFVIGAVLSFLAGMYVLGPLFVPQKSEEPTKVSEAEATSPAPSLAESVPNGVYRRDVDSVPDHTAVIVERVPRPHGSELEPPFSPPIPEQPTPTPEPTTPPPHQPRRTQPSPTQREPEVSEPISPPTVIQPPQPPVSKPTPPPPPAAETKRSYRVRVGVFAQEQYLKNMLESLTSQGYHPYVEEEFVGGQKRYRVYVGAFDNRESAERLKQELIDKGYPCVVEEKQE
jgi:cell division septation protein DedD